MFMFTFPAKEYPFTFTNYIISYKQASSLGMVCVFAAIPPDSERVHFFSGNANISLAYTPS